MKNYKKLQILLFRTIFILFALFLPVSAHAIEGYIVKYRTTGQNPGERIEYITPKAYKSVSPTDIHLAVIEKATFKLYSLNPQTKTYTDLSSMAGMIFIGMMEFLECSQNTYPPRCHERKDFLVPLGVKEKVGKWIAEKFRINPSKQGMMGGLMKAFNAESYAWYSKEPVTLIRAEQTRVKFFENAFKVMKKQMGSSAPQGSQDVYSLAIKAMKRFLKTYGVRVKQVSTINLGFIQNNTTEEFVSATKANIPAGEFRIPKGYKLQQFGQQERFNMH